MLNSIRATSFLARALKQCNIAKFSCNYFHNVSVDEEINIVFDRKLKRHHRERAAYLGSSDDPLIEVVTTRLLDRLEDCSSKFKTAVILGGAASHLLKHLPYGRAGIEKVICIDSSVEVLKRVQQEQVVDETTENRPTIHYIVADEEFLPLKPGSVDVVISCLGLHWANDLPGAMLQCCRALRPDGLFLSALFGGDTLHELRVSCALAMLERRGGVAPVVSPFAQVRDAGNLLTRAGLAIPAVDVDSFTMNYPSPFQVVEHLRALGESNANVHRLTHLRRDTALAAAAAYQSLFPASSGDGVSATYEVIFLTGWAPAPNQPKAMRRGSATVSMQVLADGLKDTGALIGDADGELLQEEDPRVGKP